MSHCSAESHAEHKAASNYGKVVKALACLLGICAWYPSEKQQAVGNLRPPLPLRLKPVRRAGLTHCLGNEDVLVDYSQNHSRGWQNGKRLLSRGGFLIMVHVLIQTTTRPGNEYVEKIKVTWFSNLCGFTPEIVKTHFMWTGNRG